VFLFTHEAMKMCEEWGYTSMDFCAWHWLDVSCQLHVPATLPREKSPVPIRLETRWISTGVEAEFPEDRGSKLPRNTGKFIPYYTALHRRSFLDCWMIWDQLLFSCNVDEYLRNVSLGFVKLQVSEQFVALADLTDILRDFPSSSIQ
jgi:hypothetical protein